jgi:hypothetical protein
MSTVLSALVVLAAVIASGVLLVQLAVSESRRSRQRAAELGRDRSAPDPTPARLVPPESVTAPVRAAQPERVVLPVYTPPLESPRLPERIVPPPPAPRVRPAAVVPAPVQQATWTPVQQVSWAPAPILSPDGAWLWTGSAWVPAWWGGPTVPPPPAYAVAVHPRPARSSGCGTALGMGCAVVLVVTAVITLALLAVADGLLKVSGG